MLMESQVTFCSPKQTNIAAFTQATEVAGDLF